MRSEISEARHPENGGSNGRLDHATTESFRRMEGGRPEHAKQKLDPSVRKSFERAFAGKDSLEKNADKTNELDTKREPENKKDIKEKKDVNQKQRAAIKEGLRRVLNGEELSTAEKGNLCEMMMDQYYISKGYTPLHKQVTSLEDKGHQGIDGVYEKDGKYVIVDAKYGTARLGETKHGRQMSEEWIIERLEISVDRETAEKIKDAYYDDPDSVSTEIFHYDPETDAEEKSYCDTCPVDEEGCKCGSSVIVETYQNGEPVGAPSGERNEELVNA